MLCTRPIVYLAMSLARGYNSDRGVDQRVAIEIILRKLRTYFLCYGGAKEFVVKSYVDASFDTDLIEYESQSGYILKVGAFS